MRKRMELLAGWTINLIVMNTQNKQGQNAQNPAKANKGGARVDEATHLEDENTNGVTTTPTPEKVEDEANVPHAHQPNRTNTPKSSSGETVAPTKKE